MRSLQTLGLACIAALSCTAVAENELGPTPHAPKTYVKVQRTAATLWQARADQPYRGRLRHLNRSLCLERYDCSTSAVTPEPDEPAREYIDALSLGDYGPMKFKFTGDRLKLKVRF